jgi:hypothetical protein
MKQCKRREEFTNWKDDIKIDFGKWVVSQVDVTAPGSCFTSAVLLASLNFRVLLAVLYLRRLCIEQGWPSRPALGAAF